MAKSRRVALEDVAESATQLAREKSWRFARPLKAPKWASFMLAETKRRGAKKWLKNRWQKRDIDLSVIATELDQLDRGFALAEMRRVRELVLELSEFVRHVPYVVSLLTTRKLEQLESLRISIAYYAPVWMGADEPQTRPLVSAAAVDKLMATLPRLQRLELCGHFFFPRLRHPTLRELRLEGHMPVFDGGFLLSPRPRATYGLDLPELVSLELVARNPSDGCGPPLDACTLRLDPKRLPALERLDLHESDLGDEMERGGVFSTIARAKILPQLKTLHLRRVDLDVDDPQRALRRLAPRFEHLERLEIDSATADEAAAFTGRNLKYTERKRRR